MAVRTTEEITDDLEMGSELDIGTARTLIDNSAACLEAAIGCLTIVEDSELDEINLVGVSDAISRLQTVSSSFDAHEFTR